MTEGLHYSKDFEYAVLGACLIEADAFPRMYGLVKGEMFYYEDNRVVFQTMVEMFDKSIPLDALTVWKTMVEKGIELKAGNIPWYFSVLTMNVVSSAHLEYHCHAIKKMWQARELEKITRSGIDSKADQRQQAFNINERIAEIFSGEQKQDWYSMDQLMFDLIVHQEEIKAGKKELIPTGFKQIDRLNGGFSPGQLIVLGARPSVGKSAIMNKISFAAAHRGKQVGIISLEMNNTEIAARLAALQTETSFGVIYRNLFNDENEHRVFYDRVAKGVTLPIFVSDKTKVDVNEIRSKAIKLKHSQGLSILIVDYLQLVESSTNKNYNREQEVAKISRGLKLLAMELQIPVIVLCQLNRAVTQRKGEGRYPQLSDLRESGAIEQDADVVLMLHRDWMSGFQVNENGGSTEMEADLLGLKWRNGALFRLPLDFNPPLMKFSEKPSASFIPVNIEKASEDEKDYF